MITRSATKKKEEISDLAQQILMIRARRLQDAMNLKKTKTKKKKIKPRAKSTRVLHSSPTNLGGRTQEQQNGVLFLNSPEATIIVNQEENINKGFLSPIFNIHVHVSPAHFNSATPPPVVQPVIHLHFDEMGKNPDDRISSPKSVIQTRVQNFLAVASTNSADMQLNFCDSSIVNDVQPNSYTTQPQIGLKEQTHTNIDNSEVMPNLPQINNNELSAEWHVSEVTQNKIPVIKLVNLKKRAPQKDQYVIQNTYNTEQDKDFQSVYPKLETKLESLVEDHIEEANTLSYKKIKKKMKCLKDNQVSSMIEDNRISSQICSDTSTETSKPVEGNPANNENEDIEVIVLDINEKSGNDESGKHKTKKNDKKALEGVEEHKTVDSNYYIGGRCGEVYTTSSDMNVPTKDSWGQMGIVATPETALARWNPSDYGQQYNWFNWNDQVAFTNMYQYHQPTDFIYTGLQPPNFYIPTPVSSEISRDLQSQPETPYQSVINNGVIQQDNSSVLCETPRRFSAFKRLQKCWSREVSYEQSSPRAPGSYYNYQTSAYEVPPSVIKRNEAVCTAANTPNKEENSESANNNRCITLLAEGCNFSEILQKFRDKQYKDKLINSSKINSKSSDQDHETEQQTCATKETPLEDEANNREYSTDDVNNGQMVKKKKGKEKSKVINSGIEVIQNTNNSPPSKENLSEQYSQNIPVASPQISNSFDGINRRGLSQWDEVYSSNRQNWNSDVIHHSGKKNFEESHVEVSDTESSKNSALSGDGATPERKIVLQEDSETRYNEFRSIKKKLRSMPENKSKPELERSNEGRSSNSQLENLRKEVFDKCMAQYSDDFKSLENGLKFKKKRKVGSELLTSEKARMKTSQKPKEGSKKPKPSKKRKSSKKKVFTDEDFIPLNASGPTKFAVAHVDKLKPYREHDAKNFRDRMLYGNTVKRFSNPKTLEMYKLKQKASGKISSKKETKRSL